MAFSKLYGQGLLNPHENPLSSLSIEEGLQLSPFGLFVAGKTNYAALEQTDAYALFHILEGYVSQYREGGTPALFEESVPESLTYLQPFEKGTFFYLQSRIMGPGVKFSVGEQWKLGFLSSAWGELWGIGDRNLHEPTIDAQPFFEPLPVDHLNVQGQSSLEFQLHFEYSQTTAAGQFRIGGNAGYLLPMQVVYLRQIGPAEYTWHHSSYAEISPARFQLLLPEPLAPRFNFSGWGWTGDIALAWAYAFERQGPVLEATLGLSRFGVLHLKSGHTAYEYTSEQPLGLSYSSIENWLTETTRSKRFRETESRPQLPLPARFHWSVDMEWEGGYQIFARAAHGLGVNKGLPLPRVFGLGYGGDWLGLRVFLDLSSTRTTSLGFEAKLGGLRFGTTQIGPWVGPVRLNRLDLFVAYAYSFDQKSKEKPACLSF